MNKFASILRKLTDLDLRFIGVQMVCALLCSQLSRVLSTIGADPLDLGYFWVIPPLTALLTIPASRMYMQLPSSAKALCLAVCSLVAAVALWLLARAGSLGFTLSEAILFALLMLVLLCAALSVPGDSYGRGIKGRIGLVAGFLAPAFLALFLSDTAPAGEVPAAVRWAFYIAATALVVGAVCTFVDSRLHQPSDDSAPSATACGPRSRRAMPGVFWGLAAVQLCSWAAFMFMWVYSTDAIAAHSFGAPAEQRITGVAIDGREYSDKYMFSDGRPVVVDGYLHIAGFYIDGDWVEPRTLVIDGDTVMQARNILRNSAGQLKIQADPHKPVTVAKPGQIVRFDDYPELTIVTGVEAVSEFSLIEPSNKLVTSHLAHDKDNTGIYSVERPNRLPSVTSSQEIELQYTCRLNTASAQYQRAGDWTGILMAVQAVVAMAWIMVIGRIRNRRVAYSVSLLLGALGFWSVGSFHSPGLLILSWALMGCAWGAMLALPARLLEGVCPAVTRITIFIPQIIAALCGGWLIITTGHAADGAPATVCIFSVGAVLLTVGAAAVWLIRENKQ